MKEFKGKLEEGPMKRLPTLAMVGGRCLMFTIKEEISSSLAQRATFSFELGLGVGDVLDSRGLESCAMLLRAEPMTCRAQVLTSEVRGARVTTRLLHVDHHMAMGSLIVLDNSDIFFSLDWLIFKQFQVSCNSSG